jgi:hypothetical protein
MHELAQEGEFYSAIVRDPRFAREVGNVVVEFGGSAHQDIIDRYLNGERVPYPELRLVWSDVVGAGPPPAVTGQMYPDFFATVRAVNATLPPERRIHVWLGEPKIDWTKIHTMQELGARLGQRDSSPYEILEREIFAKHKKALVLYGGVHFYNGILGGDYELLGKLIRDDHPGTLFTIGVYRGSANAACRAKFEPRAKSWPKPSLVRPLAGTWVQAALKAPECAPPPPIGADGRPVKLPPREMAETNFRFSGAWHDALLYLGPTASLTKTPRTQDLYLDQAYADEISRRNKMVLNMPYPVTEPLWENTASNHPFR